MTPTTSTWRLAARILAALLGVASITALSLGREHDARWIVGALMAALFTMYVVEARRGQGIEALYPDTGRRKLVMTAELIAVLSGLTVLVSP